MANPNPRGWRLGDVFIDLGSVQFAFYWSEQKVLKLALKGAPPKNEGSGSIQLEVEPETAKSILDALEIYRSGR